MESRKWTTLTTTFSSSANVGVSKATLNDEHTLEWKVPLPAGFDFQREAHVRNVKDEPGLRALAKEFGFGEPQEHAPPPPQPRRPRRIGDGM